MTRSFASRQIEQHILVKLETPQSLIKLMRHQPGRDIGRINADCSEGWLGTSAVRIARRNGLIVRRVGRRSFVLGEELVAYIARHGKMVK